MVRCPAPRSLADATDNRAGNPDPAPGKKAEPCRSPEIIAAQGYGGRSMNGLIYLVGLVVVILAVLSFFGLR
jgi:hypothetical protein